MSDLSSYSDYSNIGFIMRPNIQDAKLKAMDARERFITGVYNYANSDRDEKCRAQSRAIFGDGTIGLDDKEDCAFFLGNAVLNEAGYTGSPYAYFIQNNLDIPEHLKTDEDARIFIGQKMLNDMRAAYDKRRQDELALEEVKKELPNYLAQAVRAPSLLGGQIPDKKAAEVLNRLGKWKEMSPSVDRARLAWLSTQQALSSVDNMQELTRKDLVKLADLLSDEKGNLDELAVQAYYCAVDQHAREMQSEDSQFWATAIDSFQNFIDRSQQQDAKERGMQFTGMHAYQQAKSNGATDEEAMEAAKQAAEATGYADKRADRMAGIIQSAMNTAMEPSEKASWYASVGTALGQFAGDSLTPIIAGTAAAAATRGKGGWGMLAKGVAGWGAGYAASRDSIVNQSVAQAYLEGKENPEAYGRIEGEAQAMAENIAGVGSDAILVFKGVQKAVNKLAARAATSKVASNAAARGILAWFGTTAIEGTTELAEEELGAFLGAKFNEMARASGTSVSAQEYDPLKTIKDMKPHQIAATYAFAGALGVFGGVANYKKAHAWATNIDNLKQTGFSDKAAREIVENGILHAKKIEEVQDSNLPEKEKDAQVEKLQDQRLEYLGKQFRKDVMEASEADLKNRSDADNKAFHYKVALAQYIRNGVDEQAMRKLGLMAERQPDGNYLVTYEEKPDTPDAEGKEQQPKLIQKKWNRDQLTGFLTYQRNTAIHQQMREFQSQLTALQFAQSVESAEELGFKLANLRDVPLSEMATIQQFDAITPELFQAFAEHEAERIASSSLDAPITTSDVLPGVSVQDVQQLPEAARRRKEQALATGEIKAEQDVIYPAINISRFDGSTLVAFFAGKVNAAQMLEEMFEGRITQRVKNKENYNAIGKALQEIQKSLPGVKLLPDSKTEFSKGDIVEAYSHLAVAEVIANPAYFSHLSTAEQAVMQDVIGGVQHAQHYKLIADAWQTFKNSEKGKEYLNNGGKDIMGILSEAGFTFGKHFTAMEATAEQKVKVMEGRNFIPDFTQEAQTLETAAKAEEELVEVNKKDAQEAVVIPAGESITGEELKIEAEEKEAVKTLANMEPEPDMTDWTDTEKELYHAHARIINGSATVKDYAFYLHHNPMTDAEAIERGILNYNQDGDIDPRYTEGKRISIFKDGQYSHADGQEKDVLTGQIAISTIELSDEVPQFKTNKAGHAADKQGVVYSLPGEYRLHAPIHIWQRNDGRLIVISGRHRLAKAKEAGAEFIPATVFPEVTGRDAAWARMHDFEQNVLDNQASIADTALYVQGQNPKGRKLTEEEVAQFTRKGSNSEYGSYIGLHGSPELISYLTAGFISGDYAYQIAKLAPDNAAAQQVAIAVLVHDQKGITEAKQAAEIYIDNQVLRGSELFASLGGNERQEAFMRFLSAYASSKIRELGSKKRVHKAAKSDKSIREHEAAGIKFEDAAANRVRLNELNAEQEKWKNVSTHPELIQEAKEAFDKTDEGAQQYFDFGANFSVIGVNAKTWDKYKDKAFIGRDDNMLRAELDASQAKLILNLQQDDNEQAYFNIVNNEQNIPKAHKLYDELFDLNNIKRESKEARFDKEYAEKYQAEDDIKAASKELSKITKRETAKRNRIIKQLRELFDNNGGDLNAVLENIPEGTLDKALEALVLDIYHRNKVASNRFGELAIRRISNNSIYKGTPLKNVLDYPDLYEAYPQLEDIIVATASMPDSTHAAMETTSEGFVIYINSKKLDDKKGLLGTLLHETQHIIQNIEGFAKGANPESAGGYMNYLRHAGEIESRNVESRRNLSASERAATPFNDTLEYPGEALVNFSIQAVDAEEAFPAHPLAERIANFIEKESKRYARVLGADTPQAQAANAIADTQAIIHAIDKYVEDGTFRLRESERSRLSALRRIVAKYAQMIKDGKYHSMRSLSKEEHDVLFNALDAIASEYEERERTRKVKFHRKNEQSAREKAASAKDPEKRAEYSRLAEVHKQMAENREETPDMEAYRKARHKAAASFAKGRVDKVVADMLHEAGSILDSYLKHDILRRLNRVTDSIKIKRTASKRLKGKMGAADYRRVEQIIQLMDMSARAKDDELGQVEAARKLLTPEPGQDEADVKLPKAGVNSLIDEEVAKLKAAKKEVTVDALKMALLMRQADITVFGNIAAMDYKHTRAAAVSLARVISYGRTKWQDTLDRKTAEVKAYLQAFIDSTAPELGTDNAVRKAMNKAKKALTFLPDSMMNTAQLFLALSSFKELRPLMNDMRYRLATAQTAREKHLQNMRLQELAAFGRIIGVKPATAAGYSDKQVKQISDKFDKFYQENNQTKQTDILITKHSKTEGADPASYHWQGTKWEALGLILTYRQEDYKINAELHGFNEGVMKQLEDFVGERLMAFGNAIQQILVNDGTIKVYEEREGIPMRQNPLYFPGNININTANTSREEPLVSPYTPAGTYDFLKVRVKNTDEVKAKNAYATYRTALAERANYVYLDPATNVLTRLLAHKEFANRLTSLVGIGLTSQLKTTINEIRGASYQETSIQDFSNKGVSGMLSSAVLTALPFNIGSYMRQFSAVANAGLMPDISPIDLAKYAVKTRLGKGAITITAVSKLDAFTTRMRDNSFVNELAAMDNDTKYSTLLKWTKAGMNIMDKLDALSNTVSAAIVYNHKYDKLKATGLYSEEELRKLCEAEVDTYVRLLAQPLNRVDKSALYWSLTNKALGRALLYMGSEAINKVGMMRALYLAKKNEGQAPLQAATETLLKMGFTVGTANFVLEGIIATLSGTAPDADGEGWGAWLIATYLNAAIGQFLEIMPFLGQYTRPLFSPYGQYASNSLDTPGTDLFTSVPKLWKMLNDEKTYSGAQWQTQITRFMREFTSLLGFAGGSYSQWQWFSHTAATMHNITAGLNAGYILARGAQNNAFYADILPEEYKGKSRKRRSKSLIEQWLTPETKKKGKTSKKS